MELLWAREEKGKMQVGFTSQGLSSFGQIWHLLPRIRVGETVMKGQAIATIESTFFVKSVVTPVGGKLEWISAMLAHHPEDIVPETILFQFAKEEHGSLFSL